MASGHEQQETESEMSLSHMNERTMELTDA